MGEARREFAAMSELEIRWEFEVGHGRGLHPTAVSAGAALLLDRLLHVIDQVLNGFPKHSTDHAFDSRFIDGPRPVGLGYAESMEHLVITVLGNDRAGLVDALSGAITRNGGNWERSEMIELAGKFAGVVLVTVSAHNAAALKADLAQLESSGLLNIEIAPAGPTDPASTPNRYTVHVTGQDHPGIVHDISHALATSNCSIDELSSEVVPAPMGGEMFVAQAVVGTPEAMSLRDVQALLESIASDLMVDVDVKSD